MAPNYKNKLKMLEERSILNNAFIVALTESHLKSGILDAEIQLSGFQVFRADRRDEIRKGGVITYVKEFYARGLKVLTSGCNGSVEWLVLFLPVIKSVVINIYRPPTCEEALFFNALKDVAEVINGLGNPMPMIIMCGDYNFPNIKWNENSIIHGGNLQLQR